jgi:secreted trypsin-like serine protease
MRRPLTRLPRRSARVLALGTAAFFAIAPSAGAIASRDVRILGGAIAAPGQYPWMAAIADSSARRTIDGAFCGGTLIAPRVVLTAGHCVQGETAGEMDVTLGRTRLSRDTDGERIPVTRIVRNPGYDPEAITGDLALLQLQRPAAEIPLAPVPGGGAVPGSRVLVSGWGATMEGGTISDDLRFVRLTVRSASTCDRILGTIDGTTQLCAGSSNAGEDACQGDSGGPLFSGEGAAARLLGIVSYGAGCGHAGVPGVYTRVSAFSGWIAQQSAILNGDVPAPVVDQDAPSVKISGIGCGATTCTIDLRATGRAPAGGIVVNVVRAKSRTRKAVDRFLFAKQVRSGVWRAHSDLPFGRLTVYAVGVNAAQDDLDGDGDVAQVSIVPA